MNTSRMSTSCLEAIELSESIPFKLVLGLKCICCIISIVGNTRLLLDKSLNWLGHPNAKFLLQSHVVFTSAVSFIYLVSHFIDLVRLTVSHIDACDYMLPLWVPLTLRPMGTTFIHEQLISMFGLAVERCISTFYKKRYERYKSKKYSVLFICITVVMISIYTYYMLVAGNDFSQKVVAMVIKTSHNASRYQIYIFLQCIPATATILLLHFVLWKNSANGRATRTLCEKYQIRENRKIALLLLPIFYLYIFMAYVTSLGLSAVVGISSGLSPLQFSLYSELLSSKVYYGAVLPFFIQWRIRRKKQLDSEELSFHAGNYFLSFDEIERTTENYENKQEKTMKNSIIACIRCR